MQVVDRERGELPGSTLPCAASDDTTSFGCLLLQIYAHYAGNAGTLYLQCVLQLSSCVHQMIHTLAQA
eukprot:6206146-Pleurochrysis_carterae.AAC.2